MKLRLLFLLLTVLLLSACEGDSVATRSYQSTSVEGWEQHHVLTFPVDSVKESGQYDLTVHLRTTSAYPFQSLWLLVTEDFEHPDYTRRDTVACRLTDRQGNQLGKGVSFFQSEHFVKTVTLRRGQSGHISIGHIMRRSILPGISNVGVLLRKRGSATELAAPRIDAQEDEEQNGEAPE